MKNQVPNEEKYDPLWRLDKVYKIYINLIYLSKSKINQRVRRIQSPDKQ